MRPRIALACDSLQRGVETNRGAADAGSLPIPSSVSRENDGVRSQCAFAHRVRVVCAVVCVFFANKTIFHSNNIVFFIEFSVRYSVLGDLQQFFSSQVTQWVTNALDIQSTLTQSIRSIQWSMRDHRTFLSLFV